MIDFINYHQHSVYSMLDGMCRINEIVDKSMALKQKASCITDHGNMYSIVHHFQYAQKVGQKAIAGFEAYCVGDRLSRGAEGESDANTSRNHMVLLAKNQEGYKKLNRICSEGYQTGFYYKPRIDNHVLEKFLEPKNNDIIATSACLAGAIPQAILKGNYEEADKLIKYYQKLFNGNFYLELQPVEVVEQFIINKFLIEYSKQHGIPLSMATDAHYLNQDDKESHDVLLAIQSNALMSDSNRWTFDGNSYYMMTGEEVMEFFNKSYKYKKIRLINTKKNATEKYRYKYVHDYDIKKFEHPELVYPNFDRIEEEGSWDNNVLDKNALLEACNNTGKMADECNITFSFDKHYLPKINIPTDNIDFNKWKDKNSVQEKPNEAYLQYLCLKGLKQKFPNISKEECQIIMDRLKYELSVINNMDFPDYFLIYYDIIKFCEESNIPVGPGRGCFKPDNKCLLDNNIYTNIQDVNINDKIISHDEKVHTVLDKLEYDVDEEMLDISTNEVNINGITKDHKVFAIKKQDFDNGVRTPQWIPAEDLSVNDYLCVAE